ncbi:hypothetical protein D7Y56_00320 (plasmid) [Streptomyces sp. S501]|uniref:hypothetical protein n=1 Tax=Streptomyces sp. S501 TaxID=2420135 RepID=UPI00106DDCF2|nr:hypothetical protein [Streptomyces sp. S501]QBR04539.1 hypothetical protein D7Y56_00320 [Streptomyces sp. S501]
MSAPSGDARTVVDKFLRTLTGGSTQAQRRTYLYEYLDFLESAIRRENGASVETFLDQANIRAWLAAAQRGETRRRGGSSDAPHARAAANSMAARVSTINTFSAFCGTPVQLPRPKSELAGRLSPVEVHRVVRLLAAHPPPRMAAATWERSVAVVALAVCTHHGLADLHAMRLDDVELTYPLSRARVSGEWYPLDAFSSSVVTRWLVTRRRLTSDGHGGSPVDSLWVTISVGLRRGHRQVTESGLPATLRTLAAAHRNVTRNVLGHPVRLEQFCSGRMLGAVSV